MAPARILVLDPLTLLGRELLGAGGRLEALASDLDFRHTADEDEHQIAELAGQPALVAPLAEPGELADFDVVVVASDRVTARFEHLLTFARSSQNVSILDVARLDALIDLTEPALPDLTTDGRLLRVAHPSLVAAHAVVSALAPLAPAGGTLAAYDPVSDFGRDAIETLAVQAGHRLQGGTVKERIDGHILAFNMVAIHGDELQIEASLVLPECPLAVTRTLSGCFHGHAAHLGLHFDEDLDHEEIAATFDGAAGLDVVIPPMNLDSVPDRDDVLVTQPVISPDRRSLAVTTMVDGLRVGGALTALAILERIV